ncbi:MAG: stage V sporulation protein AD, partial [Clostridiales bacterium]|nr:stage V sporulation protein AD [Clostridiales bacterium]
MENQKLGRQTFQPGTPPIIIGHGSSAGKKETEGPLGRHFDHTSQDDTFGCTTWEKSESAMQQLALDAALKRAGLKTADLDVLLAGDLLNQCIGAGYSARTAEVPFFGLYGACSTMGESLALASLLLSGGHGRYAAAVTSSHFCSAERQYRTPLEYGSQRTPTAQWTATAAGAVIVTNVT